VANGETAELEQRLQNAALRELDRVGLALAPPAVQLLNARIRRAAKEMSQEGVIDEARIEEAERSTALLAAEVAKRTFQREGFHDRLERRSGDERFDVGPPPVAEERDLLAAWDALCPGFWPWC
jgi:hypothetical protein